MLTPKHPKQILLWQTKFTSKTTGFNYHLEPLKPPHPNRRPPGAPLFHLDFLRCPPPPGASEVSRLTPARGVEGEKRRPFRSLGCRFLELFFFENKTRNGENRHQNSNEHVSFFCLRRFCQLLIFFFRWSSSGW